MKYCTHCLKPISQNKNYCAACMETIESRYAALEEVYRRVPQVKCKGLCQRECMNVPIAPIEAHRLSTECETEIKTAIHWSPDRPEEPGFIFPTLGKNVDKDDYLIKDGHQFVNNSCEFLNREGRCTIYEKRPYICRACGHPSVIPCEYGCEAESESEWNSTEHLDALTHISNL